jgi:major vault protein
MSQQVEGKRDLVLAPGEYAYLQDETRGMVKTFAGPTVINQTAQDRPVVYEAESSGFKRCTTLEQAVKKSPTASEGDYIVLENPAEQNSHPDEGQSRPMPSLKIGRKVNIPGPCQFALWPGQRATVLHGHHLRSNQYLLVRIYNEQEAKQNWGQAVAVRTSEESEATPVTAAVESLNLTIGKLLIIKGTEVSFYIPPTGVEVVCDDSGNYVREAVTLERLEYAILVDENGNKRYERGPQVVFPRPTESFYVENNNRKYKAIELNKIQGLHIKVIADYEESDKKYSVGDELFITGEQTPIYYPRVEHSIIRYGEKNKHYATALPAGEGRYVMNRESGKIETVKGPLMLLPDPRREVIVRRILSDKQVKLWYPGNDEALAYNQQLRAVAHAAPSARSGFISEGDVQRSQRAGGGVFPGATLQDYTEEALPLEATFAATSAHQAGVQKKLLSNVGNAALPDAFNRGTGYTQPRTVTLDTKYEGVPGITVWTGYAVLVVSKTGERRVVTGPSTILLNYDESLEVLELSTGKPKTTDKLEKTVYLRIVNNKVSDIVAVRTKDHVDINLKLSYRVNFEGEPTKWFEVENYVKYLCDHVRSVLKGACQKRPVEEFHTNGVDIVRDIILGAADEAGKRAGMLFTDNGMRVTDVEVLGIDVADEDIANMLNEAQHEVVRSNIELHQAEKQLVVSKRREEINREKDEAETTTAKRKAELQAELVSQQQAVTQAKIASELALALKQKEAELAKEEVRNVSASAELQRRRNATEQDLAAEKTKQDLRVASIVAETEAAVKRFGAAQEGFSEALLQLQSQETLVKVAEALSVQNFLGGRDFTEVINKLFAGSPLQSLISKVGERAAGLPLPATNKR